MNGLESSGCIIEEYNKLKNAGKYLTINVTTAGVSPDCTVSLKNIREFSDLIPTRITYSPPATICYFPDGDKIVVKCAPDEKFVKEVGVQACIMKKLFGSRQKFLKLVRKGYDQPAKENKSEVIKLRSYTEEELRKIIKRIEEMPD